MGESNQSKSLKMYSALYLPSSPIQSVLKAIAERIATLFSRREEESYSPASSLEFEKVLERYSDTINKVCFSYAGSAADFDDLRQDALINIWRGLDSFRSGSSPRTWIFRVTVNSCLSTIRRQSRHSHESLEGLFNLIDSESSVRESVEQLHQVIAQLGLRERALIMMWLDDFSYDEIAGAMGMNRNTVATRLRRIRIKITELYQKENL